MCISPVDISSWLHWSQVILFSFALFSLPNLPSLPSRSTSHTNSSPLPSFLGRVLQAGGPGAGLPSAMFLNNTTIATGSQDEVDDDMGVCHEDTKHAHIAHDDALCVERPSATEDELESVDNAPPAHQLARWSFPSSLSLPTRKSFALTLLRPVPKSSAALDDLVSPVPAGPNDDVEDVLERWLGLNLFDGASSSGGAATQDGSGQSSAGWMVVETPLLPGQDVDLKEQGDIWEGATRTAWDGRPLERLELEEAVMGLSGAEGADQHVSSSPSSSVPSSPATLRGSSPPVSYARDPTLPSSRLLTLPPSADSFEVPTNDTLQTMGGGDFLRLDLELELGLKKREVSVVGSSEARRMMQASSGGSALGKGMSRLASMSF